MPPVASTKSPIPSGLRMKRRTVFTIICRKASSCKRDFSSWNVSALGASLKLQGPEVFERTLTYVRMLRRIS